MPALFSTSYSQDFNSLAASGTANAWANDTTILGWHLFRQPANTPVAIAAYKTDTGATNTGSFYSYGSTGSSERALGGLASASTYFGSPASAAVAGWIALSLKNQSSSNISSLTIGFSGEQWRNGGNAETQSMLMEYGYGTNFSDVTTWNKPASSFKNFTSPIATTTAAAVDGNNAGKISSLGGNLDLTATPWTPESNLWLRWIDNNDAGNDHGLAIDDLSITTSTPTPTPPASADYSNDPLKPTVISLNGSAAAFKTSISNNVTGTSDVADYVTFEVPANQILSSIKLASYTSTDSKAFIGLQSGKEITASASNATPLKGYSHFGTASEAATAKVGEDLISKFGGPLTAGNYSLWIQQIGASTDYSFDLQLSDAPASLPVISIIATDASAGEFGDAASLRISRTGSSTSALEVQLSLRSGDALATNADLKAALPASLTIPAGAASIDLAIEALDDAVSEATENLIIEIKAAGTYSIAETAGSATIAIIDNDRISKISAIQGNSTATPLLNQSITLSAIVVGDFQLTSELGGFFLQEELSDWDTSSLTSEGIYVAYPLSGTNANVVIGDRVILTGTVGELFNQTAITTVNALKVDSQARLVDTQRVDIPNLQAQRNNSLDLEPFEGMWVRFPEKLTVNGLYGQFRFGEIELSAGGLPQQPTNVMAPGAAAYAAELATAKVELVLDDGSNSSYRPASAATPAAPVRDQSLRRGDSIKAVEGIISYGFDKYRLQPTTALSFTTENPRPAAPIAAKTGEIRIASFNVLNTFSTLNTTGALVGSTGLAPRGANTAEELERQLNKLTVALNGLKADIIGLMELENDSDDKTLKTIVDRLNASQASGSTANYSFIPTGTIGTDAIKVGIIYNNKVVTPSANGKAILSDSSFTDPLSSGVSKNRPALAQAFSETATGEVINVVVNHLKSKGAGGDTGLDVDQKDGQAAFNATRTAAAKKLLDWISTKPTGNSDADWIILGDINAYAKEDPIKVFEAAGYRNALPSFTAEPASSYAFYNPVDMSGALDHMMISAPLVKQAIKADDWNINSAEGAFRDYNRDTNSNGSATVRDFYAVDPYRTSDHDPVILDLDLGRALPTGLKFNHGVASGDPYANSVILWSRISPAKDFAGLIDVQWEISKSASFNAGSIVDSGVFSTSAARDWTVKVEADGLSADTNYFYRFRSGDLISEIGKTKTLPVGSDPVRLAVFSCANFTAAEQFSAYGRAASEHEKTPYDALLHLGDYIYEYGAGGYGAAESAATSRGFEPNREIVSLEDYRLRYAQYHSDLNLQKLRSSAPLIAIWDDHETANDSWAGGAQNHQTETEGEWQTRRDAALKAYHEWLPIREPGLRQASDGATALSPLSQGYRSFNFGDVLSLHILETRLTARDEQLKYPDAAAVQARIGAILADPTLTATYATNYKLTAPKSAADFPTFGAALAQPVTQELVFAAVQKALGDPERDLIGDTQLAWLQTQLATSKAPWQILGQQVLMQSMAVPAELLLDAGNPALLDKYAAPLQKLATGTAFANLPAAEQALFAEAAKIPYNLDAWDGYGVERETILQSALALGKKLISLAGDTHNAWAGVLDTFTASPSGNKPAGTVVGVEFATQGVTSPGLEKYLPGADAYIRAKYPAVDGLDGIFTGYVNGLKYADLNRRGYLDLTVSPAAAVGTFIFTDGATETVVADAKLNIALNSAPKTISWLPTWQELDLVNGIAFDSKGAQTLLDPASYAASPRSGVQLADVTVVGSTGADRIFTGIGSKIDAHEGNDELFNTDSLGNNILIGGIGIDSFYLGHAQDIAIGGSLFANPEKYNVSTISAIKDNILDKFYIDSSLFTQGKAPLTIADFNIGTDQIFIDGVVQTSEWSALKNKLTSIGVNANAAPHVESSIVDFKFKVSPGFKDEYSLSSFYNDQDNDLLKLIAIDVPSWITSNGNTLVIDAPAAIKEEDLSKLSINLGVYDGKVVAPFRTKLSLTSTAIREMEYTNSKGAKSTETFRPASGSLDTVPELKRAEKAPLLAKKPANSNLEIGKTSISFNIKPSTGLTTASIAMNLAPMIDGMDITNKKMAYFTTISPTDGSSPVATTFTYDPIEKAGAKFYDLDGNGTAETVNLKFIDGGYGDKDNDANGVIVDPSAAGAVTLSPVFTSTGSVLTVADPTDKISPAAIILRTSISSRANTANQLGYVAFSDNETSTTITYDILKERANILFANLETGNVPSLANINLNKDISIINGQKLVFFEVVDTTLEKLMADATDVAGFGSSFRTLNLTGNTTSSSSTNGGNTLKVDLVNSSLAIGDLISAETQESPIFDFTSLSGISLAGAVTVAREANYNSIVGFYKIENATGAVRDNVTNLLIQPGDSGYQAAALQANNLFSNFGSLSAANGSNSTTNLTTFSDAGLLAPYATVANTGETFFAFGKANSDGINHFRALGSNSFGLEDVKGGFDLDYDDMIVSFNFKLATA
ncbi:ExeM/NucH family extracellular endonuclease [Synechococcus lacustris]|uniref:ExeM/NucH family extracellular endonuclease n=1 Tax=Synechococcus lacustris TaxID=2116544 RepID=UPI0020CBD694|nr:ExeM/NucH family extracellular endonuclease [Synechococcus lacustris]MCP9814689.1 ExeM/NucH family extracellular endonuclease [Synechococcus lacustris L1E-Slac]